MSTPEPVPVAAPAGVTISAPSSRLATPSTMLPRQRQPWSSSIFACYKDMGSCCRTLWCPGVTFAAMANALDRRAARDTGGDATCCAFAVRQMCCASAGMASKSRARIREKYNLEESPCSDFATHCFLSPCALCQEYRELLRFNVDLGRKKLSYGNKKKSLRQQLLFKSVTRALNESSVAEDGTVVWLTTHPGGPSTAPEPPQPSTSSALRPSTS